MIGLFKKSFSQTFDMAKSFAGGSSIKGRVGRAAGYLGAGHLGAAYIDQKVAEKKNYYGEERFNSYFGEGAGSALSGSAKMAGMWYGGWAMLGRDPLARGLNTLKYAKGKSAMRQGVRKGNRAASRLNARAADIRNRKEPHLDRGPRLVPGRRSFPRPGHEFGPDVPRAHHVNEEGLLSRISSIKSGHKLPDDFIKNLKNTPRLTARHAVLYGSMAIGGSTAASAVQENATAHMSALAIGATAGAIGGIGILGLGWAGRKILGKGGFAHAATGAGIIGAAGAGGFAAAQSNNNPISEGTIVDFARANSSGVGRMNYSTAGLVQALHEKNRRH